jgi:uncharacterized protein (DUF1800 family)
MENIVAEPFWKVAHLLRRAGFGGSAEEIDWLRAADLPTIVENLVSYAESHVGALTTPPKLGTDAGQYEQWVEMTWAWLDSMRTAPFPLVDKLALFWHGHLTSGIDKVGSAPLMWQQLQLFRTKGLGRFRDLVQDAALDPAMLRYLDNAKNVVGAANENFARELMELFTLGVHQYTQDDVVAMAKAWTGHGLDANGAYRFTPNRHDNTTKTLFGIARNWDGPAALDEIVLGSRREVSARHLVTRLWTFFAYPNPEPEVVDALAATYLAADTHIGTTLRALFLRPEFYGERAVGGLVRSPIEYVVAAMKGLGFGPDVAHPEWYLEAMGQRPFNPPNVSGWRPNGYWVTQSAQWAKGDFAGYVRWEAQKRGVLAGTNRLRSADAARLALRTFGVDQPGFWTLLSLEKWLDGERRTTRWAEQPNLIMLSLLSPDLQLA